MPGQGIELFRLAADRSESKNLATVELFDGETLKGWNGNTESVWRVEDGVIVGGSLEGNPRNEFLATDKVYKDFRLRLEYRLVGTEGFVNGNQVKIFLNDQLTVSYREQEEDIPREGQIALQIHGNCKAEISFRNVQIEELSDSDDRPNFVIIMVDDMGYAGTMLRATRMATAKASRYTNWLKNASRKFRRPMCFGWSRRSTATTTCCMKSRTRRIPDLPNGSTR